MDFRRGILFAGWALLGVACAPRATERAVVEPDVPEAWQLKKFCGRDFWPLFTPGFWSCDAPEWKAEGKRVHQSWPPPACYAESALIHDATKQIMNDRPRDLVSTPDTNYPHPLKVSDFFYNAARASFEGQVKADKPCFVEIQNARPVFRLHEKYDLDLAGFAAWKAAHTNFVGIRALTEFDSTCQGLIGSIRHSPNRAAYEKIADEFGGLPAQTNRYGWLAFLRRSVKRSEALRFGEKGFWTMFSSCCSMGHQMADAGAEGLFYEATSQECARWQVGGAFLRGASRQFGIPFGWYTANWCTGFTRDGKLYTGANSTPPMADANHRPFGGAGRSSVDRQNAYGALIGASFLEPEYPIRIHYDQPTKDSPRVPSDFARDFDDLCTFVKRNDRGVVYTPCAILLPLSVKYMASGVSWFGEHPFALNAVFHTLCPIHSKDGYQRDLRRRGLQSCLFNSEFGEIYDVLTPDSRQSPAAFAAALAPYKWAFLLERYRPCELDVASLASFVKGGGTLVVSADQTALLPLALTGVRLGAETVASGAALKLPSGAVELLEPSDWHLPVGACTAKPFWTDDRGQVAVYQNAVGKGRVLTVASKMMLPRAFEDETRTERTKLFEEMSTCRRTFPLIRELFRLAQDETMPFTVTGDIQWGVNKVKDGWLVWLINNRGVKKFAFEPEEFDAAATAEVTIVRKATGETKTVRVAPGHWTTVTFRVTFRDGVD